MKKLFGIFISILIALTSLFSFALADEAAAPSQAHYSFNPKRCSVFMQEVFGDTMCETWENLVDAVLSGEDTFACPDQHTYDWVMGQFPKHCLPILPELIDYAYDRSNSVKNGVASFTWLVSPEDALKSINELGALVEGILNSALRDDDTPFEKAAALYDYFCEKVEYDYEAYNNMFNEYVDYLTPMRVFRLSRGICSEIAPAYSFLLTQAGLEATTMMGSDHEWSYVRIGENEYHIDVTFALSGDKSLAYFMMTDEQRAAGGFNRDNMFITSNYSKEHPHPAYSAGDDSYSELWEGRFNELIRDEHRLRCLKYTESGEEAYFDFYYE